jgi:hypothetical protein
MPVRRKRFWFGVAALGLGMMAATGPSVHAALIMRIDADNDIFYIEGSDTGNGVDFGFGSYDLQFKHDFATQPSASANVTPTPQNLFVQGATLPISSGNMNMIRPGSGPGYVFIDLSATNDITALTGKGPLETVSYAGLPTADQTLFEGMIGQTFSLSIGTGYSPMSVQAVPEPTALGLTGGLTLSLLHLARRRRAARQARRRGASRS